jgi:hypothetical protein
MFGRYFDVTEVNEFADWIVSEVKRSLPAGYAPGVKDIGERAEKLNQSISKRTSDFSRGSKLNIYKKARLAARVREGMSAHGYPDAFVKSFSIDLLTRLQASSAQDKR